jgi:hypothetical protein
MCRDSQNGYKNLLPAPEVWIQESEKTFLWYGHHWGDSNIIASVMFTPTEVQANSYQEMHLLNSCQNLVTDWSSFVIWYQKSSEVFLKSLSASDENMNSYVNRFLTIYDS